MANQAICRNVFRVFVRHNYSAYHKPIYDLEFCLTLSCLRHKDHLNYNISSVAEFRNSLPCCRIRTVLC